MRGRRGQPAETVGQKLVRKVAANVGRTRGITNELVHRFCESTCSGNYVGVFAADKIPPRVAGRGNFIVIVNLQTTRQHRQQQAQNPNKSITAKGGHFVTIWATPRKILYVDPFGLPSVVSEVNRFLKLCQRPIFCNLTQIQTLDSVYCGIYAIMFCNFFDQKQPFALKFNTRRLESNDLKCKNYLSRLIRRR